MTADQYVESVKQMMTQQSTFFSTFLVILSIVLFFVGLMQWRLSEKQLESIKEKTKSETIKEIQNSLGVTSFEEYPDKIIKPLKIELDEQSQLIEELKIERNQNDYFRFFYDCEREDVYKNPIRHYSVFIDVYERFISYSEGNFNLFINKFKSVLLLPENQKRGFDEDMAYAFKNILIKLSRIASENSLDDGNLERLKEFAKVNYNTDF